MSVWNDTCFSDLVTDWKEFRNNLDNISDKTEVLEKVAVYFEKFPMGSVHINYDNEDEWPSPWEILHNRLFSENTASLMMAYTLGFLKNHNFNIEVVRINDVIGEFLSVLVDGKYLLNYEYGKLCALTPNINIEKKFKNIKRY